MSIAVQNLNVSQDNDPLNPGENNLSFTWDGMVDADEDNDVAVTATIEKDVPLTFKDSKKKTTTLNVDPKSFPVGKLGPLESETKIVLSANSPNGTTARITLKFTTAKGKSLQRDVSVTF